MPTAAEFDALAAGFEELAESAAVMMDEPTGVFDRAVLVGGRFTADVAEALELCRREATMTSIELQACAAECRHRATVCRAYGTALMHWHHALHQVAQARTQWGVAVHLHQLDPLVHPAPGPPPQDPPRPSRPALWVDL